MNSPARKLIPRGRIFEIVAATILTSALVLALLGQFLTPFETSSIDLQARLKPPGASSPLGVHWLGTDALGRDLLSLIILGIQPALQVSIISVALAGAVGTCLGAWAGLVGGRVAGALTLLSNVQLSFPFFLVAVVVIGMMTPSSGLVIGIIAFGFWVPFARISYNSSREISLLEFIDAVRVMRGSYLRIVFRHLVPNVLPNVVILSTFMLAHAIIIEASLSFLGLGMPTISPTLGRMLNDGRDYASTAWWLMVFPGMTIFILVLSINIIGEQARTNLDARLSR